MNKECKQKACTISGTTICCVSCNVECDKEVMCPLLSNLERGYGCRWQTTSE